MESVINNLVTKAGVDRNSLYMAWDFTVASEESVTGRATTIRDDAFERLGDTDLANRTIEGDSPDWTITRVLNQSDPMPAGERDLPARSRAASRARSTCPATSTPTTARPAPSSRTPPNGDITWNPSYTPRRQVPLRDPGLGDRGRPRSTRRRSASTATVCSAPRASSPVRRQLAQNANTIWCAMDFEGFAEQDLPTIIRVADRHVELQEGSSTGCSRGSSTSCISAAR